MESNQYAVVAFLLVGGMVSITFLVAIYAMWRKPAQAPMSGNMNDSALVKTSYGDDELAKMKHEVSVANAKITQLSNMMKIIAVSSVRRPVKGRGRRHQSH